jgi:hypothetical protein
LRALKQQSSRQQQNGVCINNAKQKKTLIISSMAKLFKLSSLGD